LNQEYLEHIHNIEIKNFKSIRHAVINDCRRINVFVGRPNAGKSNILEALGLFSVTQQINGEIFSLYSICRYNRPIDFFFDKDLQNKISITINDLHSLSILLAKNSVKEFAINIQTKGVIDNNLFNTDVSETGNFKWYTNPPKTDGLESEIFNFLIKYYHFEKSTKLNAEKSISLSIPNGDNLLSILNADSNLRRKYIELLGEYNLRLDLSGDFGVAKELKDGSFVPFSINLVADTLQRLFFHEAAIATNKDAVLLFEEPEAHMFPPYIAKFTTDIIFDDNKNQYFIATHSPFVLSDFIEELDRKDLSVYVVDYQKGETVIKRLTDEEISEIAQYGVDLFFNLENYLDDGFVHND
jgi:AAA15 family ATPase/GTPase